MVEQVSVLCAACGGADMIHSLKDVLMGDALNNSIAGLAVLSWFWLPWLQDISTVAALLLPILGGLWLLVQIWSRLFKGK